MKPNATCKVLLLYVSICFANSISAQTIGTFTTVTPTAQTQNLVLPSTHTFQRIIKSGDVIPGSGGLTLADNLDFTGYVPISGSSKNGRLSISSESTTAEAAILDISYSNSNHLWSIGSGGKVNFNPTDIGTVRRFCSGTVTPNGTVIVSEEDASAGNVNSDSYTDIGWLIEFNPATRTVINQTGDNAVADKLWALGRATRENAVVRSDNAVLYTGADHTTNGYLYKFVPTVPGVFSSGSLYVLRTTAGLGNGTWKLVPNTTSAQREALVTNAAAAPAAWNFNGIEDVEIGPDGKIYFTAKAEGKVYRFTDNHTVGTATDITGLEVFVGNSSAGFTYDVDGPGGAAPEAWNTGNDNLAFDGDGNLWVLQDGNRGHIWVVGPTHTQASPQVRIFATTPAGSEPTGITFTPDYNFLFLSFQHPNANVTSQLDATNTSVVFNTHTTVVIGRKSVLGPLATLPVKFTGFDARLAGETVSINWSVTEISNHAYFSVERSVNGTDFIEIHRNNDDITGVSSRSFSFNDNNLPDAAALHYRIKQCDQNGECKYTEVKIVRPRQVRIANIFPQPAQDHLTVKYYSGAEGIGVVSITDISGKVLSRETKLFGKGMQALSMKTGHLPGGMYLLTITDKEHQQISQRFMKE
ncbi:MAG TPA: alkaline phosphatase PhoX [Chitinophagaceae bacterium]|nr:alkaline phosphatase PhoX [Chitinophagaceae bacterium]